ncbi:hypothetical protein GGR57DRAFT_480909 [Xylariaceae sp. FL1272]|nr:hypothetical protein GGR57DRAFT_480909 [Xylariaceae sp. FL1272]
MKMATLNHTGTASANGPRTAPKVSPFASPGFKVYFNDEPALTVPSALLEQNPQLLRHNNPIMEVTSAVGHVIFYFLLTGKYQCLQPQGGSVDDQVIDELTTAARVFNAARKYNLADLEKLAKSEIQKLASQLEPKQIVRLFGRENLDLRYKDTWAEALFRPNSRKAEVIELDPPALVESLDDPWPLGDILLSALSAELSVNNSDKPSNEVADVAVSVHEEPKSTKSTAGTVEVAFESETVDAEVLREDPWNFSRVSVVDPDSVSFTAAEEQALREEEEAAAAAEAEAEIAAETAEIEQLRAKHGRIPNKFKKSDKRRLAELVARAEARAAASALDVSNAFQDVVEAEPESVEEVTNGVYRL